MITHRNHPIPKGKLLDFDRILKANGGRYCSNPIESPDKWGHWRVDYEYDDIESNNNHMRQWQEVLDTSEVEKPQGFFKRLLTNLKERL